MSEVHFFHDVQKKQTKTSFCFFVTLRIKYFILQKSSDFFF